MGNADHETALRDYELALRAGQGTRHIQPSTVQVREYLRIEWIHHPYNPQAATEYFRACMASGYDIVRRRGLSIAAAKRFDPYEGFSTEPWPDAPYDREMPSSIPDDSGTKYWFAVVCLNAGIQYTHATAQHEQAKKLLERATEIFRAHDPKATLSSNRKPLAVALTYLAWLKSQTAATPEERAIVDELAKEALGTGYYDLPLIMRAHNVLGSRVDYIPGSGILGTQFNAQSITTISPAHLCSYSDDWYTPSVS